MNCCKVIGMTALALLLLIFDGCAKKRRNAEAKGVKEIRMTKDQLEWRARLEHELDGKLKADFSEEAVEKKCQTAINRLLDSPKTLEKAGDLRVALSLKPDDDLDKFFKVVPTRTAEEIAKAVKAEAEAEIRKENNLLKEEDIPRVMRERLPLIPDKTKVEFKTLQGRFVSGMIVQRNKTLVKIGSRLVTRDDAPQTVRAQIWPEENELQVQKMIRDEESKNRYHYKKNLPQKIAQKLPAALLSAGYVPNLFNEGASLKSVDISDWVTRPQLYAVVKKRVIGGREAYIRDFWKAKGFVEKDVDGEKQWVPTVDAGEGK